MHIAYISLGANISSHAGLPDVTLTFALLRLSTIGRVVAQSSLYSTDPVGFTEQPQFTNAAIALETDLDPVALLHSLLGIEREFGRDRTSSFHNGPRPLDLDILFYDDIILNEHNLEIPHPRLSVRAFVLVPLNEIAPDITDPLSGKTVSQLLHEHAKKNPLTVIKIESPNRKPHRIARS